METRRLEYFVVLTAERSFSHAAARLRISQPALSQQIRRLEQDVRTKLIDRSVNPFELTPAGVRLLERSRAVLAEVEKIDTLLTDARAGRVGSVRVALVPSLFYSDLPGALQTFSRGHPDIDLRLERHSTTPMIDAVNLGQVDVGFLYTKPRLKELGCVELYRDQYVVALPADHRLTGQREVRLGQLRDEEIVIFPRHGAPEAYDGLTAACISQGFSPTFSVHEGTNYADQVGYVAAGFGVSLIPRRVATVALESVVYRPVVDPPVESMVTMMWNLRNPNLSREVFVSSLRSSYRRKPDGVDHRGSLL